MRGCLTAALLCGKHYWQYLICITIKGWPNQWRLLFEMWLFLVFLFPVCCSTQSINFKSYTQNVTEQVHKVFTRCRLLWLWVMSVRHSLVCDSQTIWRSFSSPGSGMGTIGSNWYRGTFQIRCLLTPWSKLANPPPPPPPIHTHSHTRFLKTYFNIYIF